MSEEHVEPALQKIKDGIVEYLANRDLMPRNGAKITFFIFVTEDSIRIECQSVEKTTIGL